MSCEKIREFVSFVVYLHNCADSILIFMQRLCGICDHYFSKYEIVFVDDASTDDTSQKLRWGGNSPITLVKLSVYHGLELAMNAGVALAIGDYVYEIDSTDKNIPLDLIFDAYQKAVTGNDIVTVCPRYTSFLSSCFYRIFNRNSGSLYPIRTDVFRVVSRRAINRVYSISESLPYRKAAYAASGLKQADIEFWGEGSKSHKGDVNLAINSLILYTNIGFKVSVGITLFFLLFTLCEFLYTVIIFCTGHPIEGWTTTMLVLTVGMVGLFILQAVIIKFLSLILELDFKKQRYRIESVEKLSNRSDRV